MRLKAPTIDAAAAAADHLVLEEEEQMEIKIVQKAGK